MKKKKNLLVAVLVMILMPVLAGCSKSSGTDPAPAEAYDEEIAYMIQPGRYYRVDDDLDDSYIEITEDLEYVMYGTVDWSDGTDDGELPIGLIDEGYINTTDELGKYIVYPTLYIDQDPAEIFVSEDGLLHWGGYDYPDISVWEHGPYPEEN